MGSLSSLSRTLSLSLSLLVETTFSLHFICLPLHACRNALFLSAAAAAAAVGHTQYRIRVKTIHDEILPHTNGVRYIHVKEVMGLYSIGVFVFPPRCVIPLHNHPGMTVLSRILYGSIQVKSFDIICTAVDKKEMHDTTCTTHHDLKDNTKNDTVCTKEGCKTGGLISRILSSVARSISNDSLSSSGSSTHDTVPLNGLYTFENDTQELKSPQVTALYPRRGNVHEFKAGPEGAALLDVLIPPYDSHEDRDCTFYEKVESLDLQQHESCWCDETGQKPTKCWLVPIEQPEWFRCSAGQYKDLSDK
jgi:Protein of unknown function (DUF1637).